jgi:hypothetical protein
MTYRIDAEDGIKGAVLEGKPSAAVHDGKSGAVREPARASLGVRVFNCGGLDVDTSNLTSSPLDQRQRWAASTAGDVEHSAVRPETKMVGDLSLLGCGAPARLPEILQRWSPVGAAQS